MSDKKVLIIGAGVAGLSAAVALSKNNVKITIIEKSSFTGGHAASFTCKAAEKCVKCGACIAEDKLKKAKADTNIRIFTNSVIKKISAAPPFNAVVKNKAKQFDITCNAVIMATGFTLFNPISKPYGYKKFDNVITNFELEKMIRETNQIQKPTDKKIPNKIAFIQCVGSRDASLNHLWCSKVCCGSAVRIAMLIKSKNPTTEILFFYIDIQNFGKDFTSYYEQAKNNIKMIRAIPADIFQTEQGLLITYFDKKIDKPIEEPVDMAVLSVGITPNKSETAKMLNLKIEDTGFINKPNINEAIKSGIFAAGTALGPMHIEEAAASGASAALGVIKYLGV
ncbi:MAG: CoB--CoM heterodisulfide reductase iron-sulfur subunit A family protein [Deltaproteobacteria bacterium]|nr:CoB--CoM heterodisulfide reductase iron-sulfur subunit A family protein [Deltaproteobacteria bacterium]